MDETVLRRRKVRQIAGAIAAYFSPDLLARGKDADERKSRGKRWSFVTLLRAVFLGLASGARGAAGVEQLTAQMHAGARRALQLSGRIPDTTIRTFLTKLEPHKLIELLHVVGYDAMRRKSLRNNSSLPFHALSMDGKYPSLPVADYDYLQIRHATEDRPAQGLLRTVTSTLVTASGRPILSCAPIPRETNEQGHFAQAFSTTERIYGKLYDVVMYDAGAISRENADLVVDAGKHYFFQLANDRWQMHQTSMMLLADKPMLHREEEKSQGDKYIVRKLRLLSIHPMKQDTIYWPHVRTIVEVVNENYEGGVCRSCQSRLFVTDMDASKLTAAQWLELVVIRWGVETTHQVLDTTFEEDEHPWIERDPKGALCVAILRRIVYTILSLYRSVTLQSEANREGSFKSLLGSIAQVLAWPNASEFEGLRSRKYKVSKALA